MWPKGIWKIYTIDEAHNFAFTNSLQIPMTTNYYSSLIALQMKPGILAFEEVLPHHFYFHIVKNGQAWRQIIRSSLYSFIYIELILFYFRWAQNH